MPRLRVILLARDPSDGGGNTLNYALWADVPAARQAPYATMNANAKSVWTGATTTDNTNLQTGVMVEQVGSLRVVQGTTLPQLEANFQQLWQNYQNFINNYNPWGQYGSTWDGTTWTILNNG